jgi:hypothetical protein
MSQLPIEALGGGECGRRMADGARGRQRREEVADCVWRKKPGRVSTRPIAC